MQEMYYIPLFELRKERGRKGMTQTRNMSHITYSLETSL